MWGREKAGNGVGGCAGFRSGVMAEVLLLKDKGQNIMLCCFFTENFRAVIKSQGARDFPQLL